MCSPARPSTPVTRPRCERLATRLERGPFALVLSTVPLAALVHPVAVLVPCVALAALVVHDR